MLKRLRVWRMIYGKLRKGLKKIKISLLNKMIVKKKF